LIDLSLQRLNITEQINFAGRNPNPNISFAFNVNIEKPISSKLKYSYGIGLMGVSYNTENPDRDYVIRYLNFPLGLKSHAKKLLFEINISPSLHLFNWVSFPGRNGFGFSEPSSGEMKSLVLPLSIYLGTKIGDNELLVGYVQNFEDILVNSSYSSRFNGLSLTFRFKIKEFKSRTKEK